jgi:hypothetical protein
LRRYSLSERDPEMVEKAQVLAQPHRRGHGTDQLAESPIGRLVLKHKLRREYYDAALELGVLVRHFFAARLETKPIISLGFGSGRGVSPEKAKWLAAELDRIEMALHGLNPLGYSALKTLAVHECEIAPQAEPAAIVVLLELGRLLRKVGVDRAGIQSWRSANIAS